jgi:ribulose-5-phosphate 4-epimerase/fuculose-1-phosphate aldolase
VTESTQVRNKYTEIPLNTKIPRDPIVGKMKRIAKFCDRHNFAPAYDEGRGSYGNISAVPEDGDGIIITGTHIGMKNALTDDCFVRIYDVSFENNTVWYGGRRKPSSEVMVHMALYNILNGNGRRCFKAVIHGHWDLLLKHADELDIPQTSRFIEEGTVELAYAIQNIAKSTMAPVIQAAGHGFFALGRNSIDEVKDHLTGLLKRANYLN